MPKAARDLYERVAQDDGCKRMGELARIHIGYVSGANAFFHLRPSEAERLGIPETFLQFTARNARALPPARVNASTVGRWRREDRAALLLRLGKDQTLPPSVLDYLQSPSAEAVAERYKCRTRNPWYVVPDVKIPDYFLTYMSGRRVSLVQNAARCACTNSLHTVQLKDRASAKRVEELRHSPIFQLSCEIEGHPLGGGMLKIEPREAGNILAPGRGSLSSTDVQTMRDGIAALQAWRHYEAA